MASEHDFNNVTCVWNCNMYAHCKGFLAFDVLTSFILLLFSVVICGCLSVAQGKVRLRETLFFIRVGACHILKHLEDRKA